MKYFGIYRKSEDSTFPSKLIVTDEAVEPQDTQEEEPVEEAEVAEAKPVIKLDFVELQQDFFEQIHSYIDGLPVLVSFAPLMQGMAFVQLARKVEKHLSAGEAIEQGKWKFIPVHEDNLEKLNRRRRLARREATALDGMERMVLLGAVSQFDAFLGRLLRVCLERRPDIISSSEKSFAAHEVLQYSDIEAFKSAVTEKTIETFLRKSHQEQFDWLEKSFDVKLRVDLKSWPSFIEAFERRNLFAHSQGVVSETYRIKCLEAGMEEIPNTGTVLNADKEYIASKLQVFAEIGLKLIQVLARKLLKDRDALRELSSVLNNHAYELITHGHFDLAENLLRFGLLPQMRNEGHTQLMMEVNLANSLKLRGDGEEAAKILDRRNWETTSSEFEISVEAIRGNSQKVAELISTFHSGKVDPKWCLRHWPVFLHVRDSEDFANAYSERFGEEYSPAFEVISSNDLEPPDDRKNKDDAL